MYMTFGGFFQCKTGRMLYRALYSKDMQKKFSLLVILASLVLTDFAYAINEVIFRQQTTVYSKRNENSEVLGVYDRGDAIPISNKTYGRWRKVIVDVSGKKQVGWVMSKDIRGARIRDSSVRKIREEEDTGVMNYRRRTGVGIIGNLSYNYQTKGDVTFDSGGGWVTAEYSSLSGANIFIGLFGDFNLSPTMAIRGYIAMRNLNRSGSMTVNVPGGGSGNFTIKQDMLALGATLKFYSSEGAIFWWGPGLEVAKTSKISIEGSTNISTIKGDIRELPTLYIATISAGYDFHLKGRFFILPEFKFGIVPNGDPMMITTEILIPIAFTF